MFDYFGNQLDPSRFYAKTGKYFIDITLTALQVLIGTTLSLRGQEQYFAIMRLMSVQTGAFRISIYTSTSERYQANTLTTGTTDRVRSECYFGTAQRPAVLPVPILVAGSSVLQLDTEDVSNAGNSLHLVFEGARLWPKGA